MVTEVGCVTFHIGPIVISPRSPPLFSLHSKPWLTWLILGPAASELCKSVRNGFKPCSEQSRMESFYCHCKLSLQ